MMLNELSVSGGAWRSLCGRNWVSVHIGWQSVLQRILEFAEHDDQVGWKQISVYNRFTVLHGRVC